MAEVSIINCSPEARAATAKCLLTLAVRTTSSSFNTGMGSTVFSAGSYHCDIISIFLRAKESERVAIAEEMENTLHSANDIRTIFWLRLALSLYHENKMNRLEKLFFDIIGGSRRRNEKIGQIVNNPYKFATKLSEVL